MKQIKKFEVGKTYRTSHRAYTITGRSDKFVTVALPEVRNGKHVTRRCKLLDESNALFGCESFAPYGVRPFCDYVFAREVA